MNRTNIRCDKHEIDDNLKCTLVTIQDITACNDYHSSNPMFNDTEAHIREFCKDAYQDWGTQYIFIGGDDDVKLIVYYPDGSIFKYPMIKADNFNDNAESASQQFELPPNEEVDMDGQIQFRDPVAVVLMCGDCGSPGWVRGDVGNDGQSQFMDLVAIVLRYNECWEQC